GEVGPAIAAIRRSQQREERLVLVDRQELAVAKRPAARRKVERDEPDLGKEGLTHLIHTYCDGKIPKSEMMNVIAVYGTMLSCAWVTPLLPPALPRLAAFIVAFASNPAA